MLGTVVLGDEDPEISRLPGTFETAAAVGLAGTGEIPPDQHFPMYKEIIVEDDRGAGHQERLLHRLGRGGSSDLFNEEFVLRKHRKRAARRLAPFVADQLSGRGDFENTFLG